MYSSHDSPAHPIIRTSNNVLFGSTLLLGLYIIVAPLAPQIELALRPVSDAVQKFFGSTPTTVTIEHELAAPQEQIPADNMLVIPKIEVNGKVFEGNSVNALEKGIWHRPRSSTPDKGGNTVMVAHRFLYTSGPNTFYHLDKMKVGDEITVFWDKKKYSYKVASVSVVGPLAYDIEYPTRDSILTLWTCTPLFTATNRLVVRATLVNPL